MSRYLRRLFPAQRVEVMPTRAERQRQWREWQREKGYRRLDIWLSPELWAKLEPYLDPEFRDSHPGASLVEFLEGLELLFPE